MPKMIMLVGVPGVGKSTFTKLAMEAGFTLCSSDDFIEVVALEQGKTYNEVFRETIGAALSATEADIDHAIHWADNFVVDQTNLSKKSRRKVLSKLTGLNYHCTAIVLKPHDIETWQERLASRVGKIIPPDVIGNMLKSLESPTLDEGFHEILHYWA